MVLVCISIFIATWIADLQVFVISQVYRDKFLVINYKFLEYFLLILPEEHVIQQSSFKLFCILGLVPQVKLQYDINIR
jgi:hypothetical protein